MPVSTLPTQRDAQREATRRRILESALSEFASHGFDAASVRNIAARAGVNHALIKYHFESKDRLWKEAVRFLFERMNAELPEGEAQSLGLEGVDALKHQLRQYVRYCARYPEHAQIMVQESVGGGERLEWAVRKFIRPQNERALESMKKARDAGLWPDVDITSLAYVMVAAAQTVFMLSAEAKVLYGRDVTQSDFVETHANTIVTLFFDHRVD